MYTVPTTVVSLSTAWAASDLFTLSSSNVCPQHKIEIYSIVFHGPKTLKSGSSINGTWLFYRQSFSQSFNNRKWAIILFTYAYRGMLHTFLEKFLLNKEQINSLEVSINQHVYIHLSWIYDFEVCPKIFCLFCW